MAITPEFFRSDPSGVNPHLITIRADTCGTGRQPADGVMR
jgi:hypothetical protein